MRAFNIQRNLTAMLACCVAAAAVFVGAQVVLFSIARIMLPPSAEVDSVVFRSRMATWADRPGVSIAARSLLLPAGRPLRADGNPAQDVEDIKSVLALRPMSPANWLALAEARMAAKAPASQVNAALLMSHITGPREGYVMIVRAIVALEAWDGLTIQLKQKAARDIALTWRFMSPRYGVRAVLALTGTTDEVRSDMRRFLEPMPEINADGLRRLGFAVPRNK